MEMVKRIIQGFQEIDHAADWALKVWAPDLAGLLVEAARGMTALMEMEFEGTQLYFRHMELRAEDGESLLVAFLSELLFIGESEGVGFSQAHLSVQDFHLDAELTFRRIQTQRKEIKAVTYHNLDIRANEHGLETVIVFDV
jgi:SHS2 domain-containing protein